MVAEKADPRLVVADRADHAAHLAVDHDGKEQVAQPQSQRRAPEEGHRDHRLRRVLEAGDVLQAGEAVVAPEPGVVLKEVERQRQGHRLGQDRQVDAGDAAAEGEPAEDQGQEAGDEDDGDELQRQGMRETPQARQFRGADHAEDLAGDSVGNLLGRRRQGAGLQAFEHDALGAGIHQPHADGIAADAEEGEMAKRENAAIAPDHVHGDGDERETEGLAQGLDEAGGDKAHAGGLAERGDPEGEKRQCGEEPHHRRVAEEEGSGHWAAPFMLRRLWRRRGRGLCPRPLAADSPAVFSARGRTGWVMVSLLRRGP